MKRLTNAGDGRGVAGEDSGKERRELKRKGRTYKERNERKGEEVQKKE